MKKISFTLAIMLCLMLTFSAKAQQCFGLSLKEGSGVEMASYDGKGKSNGTIRYKYTKVTSSGESTVVEIDFEQFDNKGKSQAKNSYKMRCDGNEIQIDGASMISDQQKQAFKDYKMTFTSNDVYIPQKLSVGQSLKDASVKGTGGPDGQTNLFKLSMENINRKVVSEEQITVPAGSFKAFKVTSDLVSTMQMGFPIKFQFQTVSYRAPNVLWDIKSETYSKGKMIGYTELIKIF